MRASGWMHGNVQVGGSEDAGGRTGNGMGKKRRSGEQGQQERWAEH